jgi:hypothetical protein
VGLHYQICFSIYLCTCYKHTFDNQNTCPTTFQYLMHPSNMFDDVLRLSNLCVKQLHIVKQKRKFKQWLSTIAPISTKWTITSHVNLLIIKKDHNIWCLKSRSWLRNGTQILTNNGKPAQIFFHSKKITHYHKDKWQHLHVNVSFGIQDKTPLIICSYFH